jgi:hypothetical protein
MKISQEERSAIADIVAQKILENQVRGSAINTDAAVDTSLVTEGVMQNKVLSEILDDMPNDMIDALDNQLAHFVARSMTSVNEHTSKDDVKMYADHAREQLDEIAEEVMTGIRSLLESYAKVYTTIVCEVANEPASDESLEG